MSKRAVSASDRRKTVHEPSRKTSKESSSLRLIESLSFGRWDYDAFSKNRKSPSVPVSPGFPGFPSSPTVPRLLAGSIRSLAIFLLEWPIWIGLRACVKRGGFGFSGGSGAAALEGWAAKNWVTERSYEKNILGLRRIDDAGIFRGLGATCYQG